MLIPQKSVPVFNELCAKLKKEPGELLEHLAQQMDALIAAAETNKCSGAPLNSTRLTTRYQEQGLELARHDFSVDAMRWHELKSMARFRGVSICRLFVFLLHMAAQTASVLTGTPLICRSVERLIKLAEEFFPHRKQAFRRLDLIWDSS